MKFAVVKEEWYREGPFGDDEDFSKKVLKEFDTLDQAKDWTKSEEFLDDFNTKENYRGFIDKSHYIDYYDERYDINSIGGKAETVFEIAHCIK